MRPLVVDLGRDYRGGQHQALLLVQGLRELGHAPELIAVRDSQLGASAKVAGITVHEVASHWRRISATAKIHHLLSERRVDLVHANEPHALTSAWLARAHHFVPLVASRRVALPLSRGSISLARYRAAARIIAVSQSVAQQVAASGFPNSQIEVINDGVRIPPEISSAQREASRRELGIPQTGRCIGYAAALVAPKGHAVLLRAFGALHGQFPDAVLLLWGEGPEKSNLINLASQLQIFDAVRFVGTTVSFDSALAAMDVFAFPSHSEALGSALLAAMARALPVVAAARDGMTEVVDDGKNGLLVKDLEPAALAASISRLLTNPEEARTLGNAARATVMSSFSAEQMVGTTLRLYETLTSAGNSPNPQS